MRDSQGGNPGSGETAGSPGPARAAVLAGPALALAALVPLPVAPRVVAALLAVLVGWPLASWPFWKGWVTGAPAAGAGAPDRETGILRLGRLLAAVPALAMLPALLLTALGLAGVPLSGLLVVLLLLLGATAVAGWRRRSRPDTASFRPVTGEIIAVAAAALLLAGAGAFYGSPVGATDDAFDHIATLRHLIESDRVELPGVFHAVASPRGLDPRKGALSILLALAGRLSRADALDVWRWSAAVITPLMGLAYLALALALFRRFVPALASLVALTALWNDPFWLLRGAYGGHWGLAIAWAGGAGILAGGGWIWGALAGAAAASVHAYAPAQLLAPLAGAALLGAWWRGSGLRIGVAGLAGAVMGALPVEAARLLLSAPRQNPLHEQSMSWMMLPPGPVASPLDLLSWYGWVGIAAVPAVLLAAVARRDRTGTFLLASGAVPAFLLLNPFLLRWVGDTVGSLANKVALVWAYPMALVWVAGNIIEWRRPARPGFRLATAAGLVLLAPALALTLPGRMDAWVRFRPGVLSGDLDRAAALLRSATPPGAVVASDAFASYAIPALTGRRTIVTLNQHSPPGDARAPHRLAVAAAMFSTCVPLPEALEAAVEEGADHLLARGTPAARIDLFGAHLDPRNAPLLQARFASRPDLLQPVGTAGGWILYRIRTPVAGSPGAGGTAGPGGPAPGHGGGGGPTDLSQVDPPPASTVVTDGTVSLAVQSFGPMDARRGGRLTFPVAWRLERESGEFLEVTGHLRFENEALISASGGEGLLSKPLRRFVLEPRAGSAFRWRAVELPLRGLCPVAGWTVGGWLPDTLELQVPGDILPGVYRVRVGIERGSLYPTLFPADLLSDRDRYSGPVAGRLEIQ